MAKNFGNAGSMKKIKEVAKASNEKATLITVKMIGNNNLIDYPNNNEDITDTTDLEKSMKELGFTDPIEVTSFNMEEGKYMIVSGHRRRAAGVKVGIETFPCIIKNFSNESDINNYVLMSNAQRDSAKDPLLFCKRYKMHEEFLKNSDFKGNIREEVAKRLGISIQQADRYNSLNKIIEPVLDMIKDEIVGMSSVLPMASHTIEEQLEIYDLLNEHHQNGNNLSRDVCNKIIKGYRKGEGLKKIFDTVDISQSDTVTKDNKIHEPKEIKSNKEENVEPIVNIYGVEEDASEIDLNDFIEEEEHLSSESEDTSANEVEEVEVTHGEEKDISFEPGDKIQDSIVEDEESEDIKPNLENLIDSINKALDEIINNKLLIKQVEYEKILNKINMVKEE